MYKILREMYFLYLVTMKYRDQKDRLRAVNEHSNVFLNFRVLFCWKLNQDKRVFCANGKKSDSIKVLYSGGRGEGGDNANHAFRA